MNKTSLSKSILLFLSKSVTYVANVFGIMGDKIENKSLELKEKRDEAINIPKLKKEYEQKINEQLDNQYNSFKKLTAEITKGQKKLENDKHKLSLTAREINRAEDEAKTVNIAEMSNIERIQHEFSLKNMRLEASSLMRDINFNQKFLGDQQQTLEAMLKNYHENKFKAKQVISELTSLEHRNSLLETKHSIENIELGLSNYKISDILMIVEGKEADSEAQKFADAVLLREGTQSFTDIRIEEYQNNQLENELNQYLIEVRESENTLKKIS